MRGTLLTGKFRENGKFWKDGDYRIVELRCWIFIMRNLKIIILFSRELLAIIQVLRLICPAVYYLVSLFCLSCLSNCILQANQLTFTEPYLTGNKKHYIIFLSLKGFQVIQSSTSLCLKHQQSSPPPPGIYKRRIIAIDNNIYRTLALSAIIKKFITNE